MTLTLLMKNRVQSKPLPTFVECTLNVYNVVVLYIAFIVFCLNDYVLYRCVVYIIVILYFCCVAVYNLVIYKIIK